MRLTSIDERRGLVMVLMALDHVRDMVTPPRSALLDFSEAGAALFFTHFGVSLGMAYVLWVAVVLALFPACRWFAAVKARRREWWLSYL